MRAGLVRHEEKGTTLEPTTHPDLIALGHVLRARMDRTLDAEMEAARSAAQRRRSLRDRLLTAEDADAVVVIGTADGSVHGGPIAAVGTDHIALVVAGRTRALPLHQITSVEVCG
jgi:hypothetical protein